MLGWSVGGLVALAIARVVYQFITPFDAHKELIEDRNIAVGYSYGMFMVAAAILLHGIISGEPMAIPFAYEVAFSAGLYIAGLGLLWAGRIALKMMSKFDLDEEIHVKDNPAIGLVEGFSYIGFAIIVHAAL